MAGAPFILGQGRTSNDTGLKNREILRSRESRQSGKRALSLKVSNWCILYYSGRLCGRIYWGILCVLLDQSCGRSSADLTWRRSGLHKKRSNMKGYSEEIVMQ